MIFFFFTINLFLEIFSHCGKPIWLTEKTPLLTEASSDTCLGTTQGSKLLGTVRIYFMLNMNTSDGDVPCSLHVHCLV